MFDSEAPSRILALAAIVAVQVPLILVLVGIVLRFASRPAGSTWAAILVFSIGVAIGFGVVLFGGFPLGRMAAVAAIGGGFILLLWRDRRTQAGTFLIGGALPWTVTYAWVAVLLVTGRVAFEPFQTAAFALLGIVPVLIGTILVFNGDPPPPDPDPFAPAGRPGSRRIGVVARAVLAPESLGPLPISELAAFLAVIAVCTAVGSVGLPSPLEPVAQVGLATIAGAEARVRVRPARGRRAYEAFSWLGEWEFARVRAATNGPVPATERGARTWLAREPDKPETRWLRVELLAWLARFDEARAVALTMPEATPFDRFERAFVDDLIDWMAGGDGDQPRLRAAADALPADDPDMALRAEVALAVRATARLAASEGIEAAAAPLVAVRERLGARADGQLRRALWRRFLPISLVTALFVVLVSSGVG